ncbi:lysozyme inhibitor LprI family protein [Peristeroidobacter agariperforans]|uniref:lysozyme inhibitor LprI family protein n=1 Tax=Peristeroidobacter agariperforans TaxID=268404 RepID=UPI00101CB9E4|nr:lysozyme inhibitor LprI family protein [Peristeroidobacter agariperforans]
MNTRRFLVLLLLFPALAWGAEYTHTVGDHTYVARKSADCFEISEHAAAECVRHFFAESEQELETSFDSIRSRLVRDRELFEQTQAKWVAFKDSECEVRSVSAQAFSAPERQKALFVWACAAELNEQRVLQLKSLSLGCDSCLQ